MFGIFDGHNGGETSSWLRENLLVAVTGHLADLYNRIKDTRGPALEPTSDEVETTLKTAFKEVDDHIVNTALELVMAKSSKYEATNVLAPAYAGSCALVSFYDSIPRLLHVALTGDSRAVLGRYVRDADGKTERYEVVELSVDQNAHNAAEEARLLAQHPGEVVVKGGRVLGWGLSRAFGDARMKWSLETQKHLKETLLGRSISPTVKTPPYFTAEPEVVSVEVQPGDFLIMASDGLWESLTNEEAVGLVGWWLKTSKLSSQNGGRGVLAPSELPIKYSEEYQDVTVRHRQWNVKKRFVTTDENVATHLIRNALGGADEDLVAALLSMCSPRARSY
jgi:pyruvate dehydrogenase phosphatase